MSIKDWNNICNRKFIENLVHLKLRSISYGCLIVETEENLKKLVVEDLHKSYSANHWEAIRELFQILGFTGINDIHILPGNIILAAFAQSCERFIVI
ncbi:9147_t:CDS:2 [Funneliformis geosporum]|uniref:9147_t:CDS:1 n=1 Tax=Funneliformis geosporum TaxID=1117311 RepID=A0A9W4X190_9GLOM|nr:9147_t:CDS:2 [Funneliformis geosporum]